MIQLNYNNHHHHNHHHRQSHEEEALAAKFDELSDDNNNLLGVQEDLNNKTLTNLPPYTPKESTEEAETSGKEDADSSTGSSSASSSCTWSLLDDDLMEDVKPKKSCLVQKSKLFIDTTEASAVAGAGENNNDSQLAGSSELMSAGPADATSSPLFSGSDSGLFSSCCTQSLSNSMSLSISSSSSSCIHHTNGNCEPSSPSTSADNSNNNDTCLSTSPPLAAPTSSSSPSTNNNAANPTHPSVVSKKRVLFADSCGKELFTIRTMSEPSNCPPKLTSKIVQYFLNREFNNSSSMNDLTDLAWQMGQTGASLSRGTGATTRQSHSANDLNSISSSGASNSLYHHDNSNFFSLSRSYDYGISALNYTTDVNQLSGSIAVYSLNFAQPAGDYLHFRKRLEESFVSLENVVLNLFQINGTIKVKNIDYHKQVFVRCSFDGWKTFEDYQAEYVPSDFYSAHHHHSATPSSPTHHSSSATFYVSTNNSSYVPQHKEYDTFRFEFQLPKTVGQEQKAASSSPLNENNATTANANKELYSDFGYGGRNLNLTASIQMCVCYRSGGKESTGEAREFWDSNHGKNYEILQYVIDIERLKPSKKSSQNNKAASVTSLSSSSSSSSTPVASSGSSIPSSFSSHTYHELGFDSNKLNGIYY